MLVLYSLNNVFYQNYLVIHSIVFTIVLVFYYRNELFFNKAIRIQRLILLFTTDYLYYYYILLIIKSSYSLTLYYYLLGTYLLT